MKTPDKIYIPNDIKVTAAALLTNGIQEGDAEYIRKDALMEWIQEARAIPHENAIARDNAFVEIINIINSIK